MFKFFFLSFFLSLNKEMRLFDRELNRKKKSVIQFERKRQFCTAENG